MRKQIFDFKYKGHIRNKFEEKQPGNQLQCKKTAESTLGGTGSIGGNTPLFAGKPGILLPCPK
jgi:hypothetical protein